MLLSGICLLGHYSTATLQYVFEVVVICFFSMYLFEFHFIERIYVSIDMYIYTCLWLMMNFCIKIIYVSIYIYVYDWLLFSLYREVTCQYMYACSVLQGYMIVSDFTEWFIYRYKVTMLASMNEEQPASQFPSCALAFVIAIGLVANANISRGHQHGLFVSNVSFSLELLIKYVLMVPYISMPKKKLLSSFFSCSTNKI